MLRLINLSFIILKISVKYQISCVCIDCKNGKSCIYLIAWAIFKTQHRRVEATAVSLVPFYLPCCFHCLKPRHWLSLLEYLAPALEWLPHYYCTAYSGVLAWIPLSLLPRVGFTEGLLSLIVYNKLAIIPFVFVRANGQLSPATVESSSSVAGRNRNQTLSSKLSLSCISASFTIW